MIVCAKPRRGLLDRGGRGRRPTRRVGVAPGLVADVDDDVVLLAVEHVLEADPVVGGVVERPGGRVLAVSGGVVHLQDADEPVGLALADDRRDVRRAVPAPAIAVRQDDADGVGPGRLDVGERLRLSRVPGVGVVDAAHDEVVAVALDQTAVADVETGGPRLGPRLVPPVGGLRGGRAEGAGEGESEEGRQPAKQQGEGLRPCRAWRAVCRTWCCSHCDSRGGRTRGRTSRGRRMGAYGSAPIKPPRQGHVKTSGGCGVDVGRMRVRAGLMRARAVRALRVEAGRSNPRAQFSRRMESNRRPRIEGSMRARQAEWPSTAVTSKLKGATALHSRRIFRKR